VVIAEALGGDEDSFARMMTRKARALGMSRTTYVNASGLPDDAQITTARDQALLGRAIQDRFPRYYRYFSTPSFTYHGVSMRNHNHLLGRVDGVDGIKTGYIHASGFNLVTSVHRGNRHLVAVVLGGRSAGERDARMRELIGQYIAAASTRRTAPMIAERAEPAEPQTTYTTASAPTSTPARPDAVSSGVLGPQPAPGSSDPIKPLLVKTISVKPAAIAPQHPAAPTASAAIAASAPLPPPPGARPGVLGVLPAVTATAGAPKETTPAAQAYAAPETPAPTVATSPAAAPAVAAQPTQREPASHPAAVHTGWMIQVGAFDAEDEAKQRLESAKQLAKKLLGRADPFTETVVKGDKTYYRARFAGLEKDEAEAACKHLKRKDIACMPIKN
jgi:D-alanyl-D-alanine carboxypeptidase